MDEKNNFMPLTSLKATNVLKSTEPHIFTHTVTNIIIIEAFCVELKSTENRKISRLCFLCQDCVSWSITDESAQEPAKRHHGDGN